MKFQIRPTPSGTEIQLIDGELLVPTDSWPLCGRSGADICQRWIIENVAIEDEATLIVEHAEISRLSARDAASLDLPATTQLRAVVEGRGIMMRPDYSVMLRWTRSSGQHVIGAERLGAWIKEGQNWRRLPETLFGIAEAVDAHNAAGHDEARRLVALAALRRALPPAAIQGTADASGLLGAVTIIEADALSLEAAGDGDDLVLLPVLHGAGLSGGTSTLLSEKQQQLFGQDQFYKWPTARGVYSLPGGVYITIAPPLRQALEVVRQKATAPIFERRQFLREPRAAIRAAIGDEADAALIDSLFVETQAWSDRVIGLGLWKKRVLPWLTLQANDWFSDSQASSGLNIDGQEIPLSPDEATILAKRLDAARENGEISVDIKTASGLVGVPVSDDTTAALESLANMRREAAPTLAGDRTTLLIKPNETAKDIEAMVQRRGAPPLSAPVCLSSTLKEHQKKGLLWLQENWITGSPGALLADDMGLGKTLQGLAFLAWLREGMITGVIERRPILVVAPTSLLYNWLAEHDTHLNLPGLGLPTLAFAQGLKSLRSVSVDGGLDIDALRSSDWVLTTYETLRDYDKDFGAVHFGAMLMDEAQKIKTPGIRMTDAAKAMHADFRIAMTGTPVENRLSDLWCIVDGIAPGYLGDLRSFSRDYEADVSPDRMAQLKSSLDRPLGSRPALLLRRLKEDELPGLPARRDILTRNEMQGRQLDVYMAAVSLGRGDQVAGKVLEALQRMRAASLHSDPDGPVDDDIIIAGSARLRAALTALDEVSSKGERALVFVEDLAFMARLTGLFQRRYRLKTPPMAISGAVAGAARQARVNLFQEGPDRFDVMLLSPRAGGVGLTITRANHVIHLTRWWNPAVEDQSTARVLRIGQVREVFVHTPLATLPGGKISFDESLDALLRRKRELTKLALLPPAADSHDLAQMLGETTNL